MNTSPLTILVTSRPKAVIWAPRSNPIPGAKARIRYRYRAEIVSGPFAGEIADGFPSSDEAIGALIRQVSELFAGSDSLIDFIASLFGDLSVRSADETLGRAVRFAARDPRRRSPGLTLTYGHAQPKAVAATGAATAKGGVA